MVSELHETDPIYPRYCRPPSCSVPIVWIVYILAEEPLRDEEIHRDELFSNYQNYKSCLPEQKLSPSNMLLCAMQPLHSEREKSKRSECNSHRFPLTIHSEYQHVSVPFLAAVASPASGPTSESLSRVCVTIACSAASSFLLLQRNLRV